MPAVYAVLLLLIYNNNFYQQENFALHVMYNMMSSLLYFFY